MAGAVLCDRFAGLSTHSTQWGFRESYQGSQMTGCCTVAAAAHETIIPEVRWSSMIWDPHGSLDDERQAAGSSDAFSGEGGVEPRDRRSVQQKRSRAQGEKLGVEIIIHLTLGRTRPPLPGVGDCLHRNNAAVHHVCLLAWQQRGLSVALDYDGLASLVEADWGTRDSGSDTLDSQSLQKNTKSAIPTWSMRIRLLLFKTLFLRAPLSRSWVGESPCRPAVLFALHLSTSSHLDIASLFRASLYTAALSEWHTAHILQQSCRVLRRTIRSLESWTYIVQEHYHCLTGNPPAPRIIQNLCRQRSLGALV